MIMVSFVIGMGIFRTPVNVAKASIDPAGYLFAWLAGGGIALCGALTYAEIGSRYPVTGGYFKVFSMESSLLAMHLRLQLLHWLAQSIFRL